MIDGMERHEPIRSPEELLRQPTISVVEAGIILGIGRTKAFEMSRRGEIPTFPIGRKLRVSTAELKAKYPQLVGEPVASR
jgi:hypothetical protein